MSSSWSIDGSIVARRSWFDRAARRLVLRHLDGLRTGSITLVDGNDTARVGTAGGLQAAVRVNDARFYRRTVLGGSLGAAASYLDGDWDTDDLVSLFRIFAQGDAAVEKLDSRWSRLSRAAQRLVHRLHDNSLRGSRANIHAHYDLGNDFFRLWLDETMAYSSAIFPHPQATLREGSLEKFDRVCRKLDLRPGDHLLEIGTGWGGLALHAATHYGCRVTTTTISAEQHRAACQRVAEAGLSDRVSVLSRDYRELTGQFDKLVSLEMIEAVGYRHFDTFLAKCASLLRPDGTMLLQAITMPERGYSKYLRSVDFIQRYVFPGGCLPSVAALLESAGRASDLRLVHLEEFGRHYAETLRRWRAAFDQRRGDVLNLGYDKRLLRLWDYYLCYCEAGFEERRVGVVQLQFDRPGCHRDPLRISRNAAASAPIDALVSSPRQRATS